MSSIVYLKNKTNGRVYAYLNESVWDRREGKCRCKRKCLGHVDPVTGDIVPNKGKRDTASIDVKTVGVSKFLGLISERIGLTESIKAAFPGNWKLVLTCMFYILRESTSMSRIRSWSIENDTPFRKRVTDKELTELFSNITDNTLFSFFREWRDHFKEGDFYMFHTASETSFDRGLDTVRFNDLPDVSVKPETCMSITFNQRSGLPVTYTIDSRNPVSYMDIRKSESDIRWLEFNRTLQVLDMDYCNAENLNDLLNTNHRFLLRASPQFEYARDSIERVKDRIMDLSNFITIDGEPFFVMSFVNYLNGKKYFVHIYFSPDEAQKEFSLFLSLIEQCEKELKSGILVREHEAFYDRYFIRSAITEKNGEAIMSYNDVAGFFVLISNTVKNPSQAFRFFKRKRDLQRAFDNIQNERDRESLNLDSEMNYRGLLFLRFLSYILYAEVKNRIRSYPPTSDMHFYELMDELSSMKRVIVADKVPQYTQINPVQMKILKAFGIDMSDLHG